MSKYKNNENAVEYYVNGFAHLDFQKDASLDNFLQKLTDLNEKELKPGFQWEKVYPDTVDLKPNAYDYDSDFLDFIFTQKIPQILKEQTGFSDLVLGDLAIRKVYPGSVYMGWHRDTYAYHGQEPVGRMPPLQKLIFYPCLGQESTLQLECLPSSHHRVFRNKWLDKLQAWFFKSKKIHSSDQKYLLFDSALYHSVPEGKQKTGAVRVFFIFCHKNQLELFKGRESLHQKYLGRLQELGLS